MKSTSFRDEADESEEGQEDWKEDEEGEGLDDVPDMQKSKGDRFFQMGDMDRFAEDAEQAAMRSDDDEDEDETGEHPRRLQSPTPFKLNMRLDAEQMHQQ